MRLSVIVPTCNAAPWLDRQLQALLTQTTPPDEILLVDSASTDDTPEIAARFADRLPLRRLPIAREDFDHGGTRTMAAQEARGDILVCLTQDAIPADKHALARLSAPFASPEIAVTYGRQLPHPDATPFAAHLRAFNYPDTPEPPRFFADRERLGLRAVFCSNSFAAWRKEALAQAGFFPSRLLFGEDTLTVAKLLALGYGAQYAHDALVFHSHNHSLAEEVRRYFDIGAFHGMEAAALLHTYGGAGGAGRRFVLSELRALAAAGQGRLLPLCLARNAAKLLAYKLGLRARRLPLFLIRRLSMRPDWWTRQ